MPTPTPPTETYSRLVYELDEKIRSGMTVIHIKDNFYKLMRFKIITYWYQDEDKITLIAQVLEKHQGYLIVMVGKNPAYKGQKPHASELYLDILDDVGTSIRLIGDNNLSTNGYDIWKRLLKDGHHITFYNMENPGQSFITFTDIHQMDQYFKDKSTYKYQFVLSENSMMASDVRSFFYLRRYWELSGTATEK